MRFFSTLAVAATGLASFVAAQTASGPLYFTWIVPASIEVGKTYNVSYVAANIGAPVEILLRKGASSDLKTIATLTSSATGGSYQWTVASSLPNGAGYALQIKQGSDENYSRQFTITGSTAVESSSSASASGSVTSSSASSSSTGSAGNSTVTSGSITTTRSGSPTTVATSSRTGTASTSAPLTAPTGAASNIKSPLALIFGAVAAMAYFH